MLGRDFKRDFTIAARLSSSTVLRFSADHLDTGFTEIGQTIEFEGAPRGGKNSLGELFSLLAGINTIETQQMPAAPLIAIGTAHFVGAGCRQTGCPSHRYQVVANLLKLHLRKVTDHIRQDIGLGITNFIDHLLSDSAH